MTTPATNRRIPTASQVLKRQAADAERALAEKNAALALAQKKVAAATAPAKSTAVAPAARTAVAMPDTRTSVQSYLDEVAPSSIVGRMIKFDKNGTFVTPDDEGEIKDSIDFIALCDMTLIGWIKFNEDAPPDRRMGLLYDGFVMPRREELGDLDPNDWPVGLSGEPEDPQKHQIYLVLQQSGTTELFTFVTSSKTGRRAVGNLLRHYDRMRKSNADEYPVIRLKKGGFEHKDARIGFVPTPVFAVVGRAPRDSTAKPDTSLAADMNDEIPFTL